MSTNEDEKPRETIQNGNQNSETSNFLENKPPNLLESVENIKEKKEEEKVLDETLPENERTIENFKNSLENICEVVDKKESDQILSSDNENSVLPQESNILANTEVEEPLTETENTETEEDMSRTPILKSRLPNKTTSKSGLSNNTSKIPGELTGTPSIKATKDDIKYWKSREAELLNKIADLEKKVKEKDSKRHGPLDLVASQVQEKLENDLVVTKKEKENYKNRLQTIEKELTSKQKEILCDSSTKTFKTSDEVINHLKQQNEDLRNALAKMTAILRDKTTMCITQEKKIAALTNQVESLKEVVAITKDLLNIRNMEVQHLSNDISAMETKIDCERQRHNQMLIKMDEAVKLNTELKKEYENQLKLFQHLRDSYEEKILLLSRDSNIEHTEGQNEKKE